MLGTKAVETHRCRRFTHHGVLSTRAARAHVALPWRWRRLHVEGA